MGAERARNEEDGQETKAAKNANTHKETLLITRVQVI